MAKRSYFIKDPSIPADVSQKMVTIGSIGGKISAHKRWGTPLSADIVAKLKAKEKKAATIKKAKAKLQALKAQKV